MNIATKFEADTTDTLFFVSGTTNVLLFKFRCNIFIGVRIMKEMPGSVASGTHCINQSLTLEVSAEDVKVKYFATLLCAT
jgi:hypothetical protein